jgi:hypothetical protein
MSRRLSALLIVALFALVAGCGGGDKGSSSSLDDKLGYLPKDAPLVAVVNTDVDGEQYRNLDRLLSKFPFAGQVKNQLKQAIAQSGADYTKDVKPLLGGELVVGSPDARSLTDSASQDAYVVAWDVGDGDKLRELVKKEGQSRESGKVGGETAYESDDGSVVIVKGDLLVGANDRPTLQAAIDRKDGDDKLTEEQFKGAFGDLPESTLVKVYGDAQKLLESDPATATARQVKWVAGLRTFGVTVAAERDGLALDVRVNTENVGPQDLPLAAGDESPQVARTGVYAVGLRNAQQLIAFVQNTAKAVDPEGFAKFQSKKDAAGSLAGIDIDRDLIGQLTGATSVTGGLDGSWALRSEPKDPAALEQSIARLVAKGKAGDLRFKESDGLVELTDESGEKFYFGIVDGKLVASPDATKAKAAASAPAQAVPGAKGALVAVADGEAIAKSVLAGMGGNGALGGQFFTGPIGDLTAWMTSGPDAMRGRLKLTVK